MKHYLQEIEYYLQEIGHYLEEICDFGQILKVFKF